LFGLFQLSRLFCQRHHLCLKPSIARVVRFAAALFKKFP
jgi:hypothetical protein